MLHLSRLSVGAYLGRVLSAIGHTHSGTVTLHKFREVPKPEVIASALHLKWADVVSNWETRSGVKVFIAKFLTDKAHMFWDYITARRISLSRRISGQE